MRNNSQPAILSRKLHISWYVAAVSGGILLGTAVVPHLQVAAFTGLGWLIAAGALIFISIVKRTLLFISLAFIGGILVGLWYGSMAYSKTLLYRPLFGQEVTLSGRVSDDTSVDAGGDQRMRLEQIVIDGREFDGQVWVNTESSAAIKRGDIVMFNGVLSGGFGNLSAAIYDAGVVNIERPHPGDVAGRAREYFADSVYKVLPAAEASLGISFITGMRSTLPSNISEQLRMLGLVHVVVASGFHLSIVIRVARKYLAKHSKYLAVFISAVVIVFALLMTGFSTSMTRAALVTGISLIAWYYGRAVQPIILLLLVAAITVIIEPGYIWGDIGWLLSFTAFFGVIVLAPLIDHYFWGQDKEPGNIRHIIVGTTAAQITTFPVVAYFFGHYSPLALVSNLLILPLLPLAMLLTFLSGIAALISMGIAKIIAMPTYLVLHYMTTVTERLSLNQWATSEIDISINAVILFYVLTLMLIIYLWRVTGHDFRHDNPIK